MTEQNEIPEPLLNFETKPGEIRALANQLENAEGACLDDYSDESLAEYISALKWLSDACETARKQVFEPELSDRVNVDETIGDVRKMQGSNSYVTDHEGAFDAVLNAGIDPREVANVSASKLRDALGSDADDYLGESTYSYFRRQG